MKIVFHKMTAQEMLNKGIKKAYYFNVRFLILATTAGLFEAAHEASHYLRWAY